MDRTEEARKLNQGGNARLWVPRKLPGLNDLIELKRSPRGGNSDGYSMLKKEMEGMIGFHARAQGFPRLCSGLFFWTFFEPNRKRDPSNVAAGAIKLIEDALVDAGLLEDDGWENVRSIEQRFELDWHAPGVQLAVAAPVFWHRTTEEIEHERQKRLQLELERRKRRARAVSGFRLGAGCDAKVPSPAGKAGNGHGPKPGGGLPDVGGGRDR